MTAIRTVRLSGEDDYDGWRDAARALAADGVPPGDIVWQVGEGPGDLFGGDGVEPGAAPAFTVPRRFPELAREAILHRDPARFALLYTLLLRLRAEPGLIEDRADPLLRRIEEMARSVGRDVHKMRAFVRFREVEEPDGDTRYIAFFEPEHHIVRANAGFFVRRFANMRWSILTPDLSIHWDGAALTESPGATRADAPAGDPVEEIWRTYYASIFNPARLKTGAMLKEMPRKYWANMPETALVPQLIAGAQARESGMIDAARSSTRGNSAAALEALREEARGCRRCHLWEKATQTVFGEGPATARLMLVGEQPGDQEDIEGRPFVGPAGKLLDRALREAGIERDLVYVTNAVKHFKFEPRGKRRIHSKPQTPEIQACKWWMDQERALIRPDVTVMLGATAARSLLGKVVTISGARGRPIALPGGGEGWVTIHPGYLLRLPDRADMDREYLMFVEDLARAKERMDRLQT